MSRRGLPRRRFPPARPDAAGPDFEAALTFVTSLPLAPGFRLTSPSPWDAGTRPFELHDLAELYHENSKRRPGDERLPRTPAAVEIARAHTRSVHTTAPRLPLPRPAAARPAVPPPRGRATPRSAATLDRHRLGDWLHLAFADAFTSADVDACELHLELASVPSLAAGRYRYDSAAHCLEQLDAGRPARHRGQPSLLAWIVIRPWRLRLEHGPRGYRLALQQAGRLSERLRRAAQTLGLALRPFLDFFDDDVHARLDLDGVEELVVEGLLVGTPPEGHGRPPRGTR